MVRISAPGSDRQDVPTNPGETLGNVFSRVGIDVPAGSNLEVWVNGEQMVNWQSHLVAENDAVVLMPTNLKGA